MLFFLFFLYSKKTMMPEIEANKNPTNAEPKINLNEKTLPCSHNSSIIKFLSKTISLEFFSKNEPTL